MTITIYVGDCRNALADMDAESVQCVVTSPPYHGLRDYKLPPSVWGGDEGCAHVWGDEIAATAAIGATLGGPKSTLAGSQVYGEPVRSQGNSASQGQFCQLCSAWRGCLGLEPTIDMFVSNLVKVFRGVRRVLRGDGVAWLNLGDSYMSNRGNTPSKPGYDNKAAGDGADFHYAGKQPQKNLKPKDLCLIPFRVALALQADGWYVRSVAPWIKANSMPESVTDRPTTAHEYWIMLTKNARYFYDGDAVRQDNKSASEIRYNYSLKGSFVPGSAYPNEEREKPQQWKLNPTGRNRRTSDTFNESLDILIEQQAAYLAHLKECRANGGMLQDEDGDPLAMLFNSYPLKAAHFASFPPKMIEPLVKCSTSERGACVECGAAWERVTDKSRIKDPIRHTGRAAVGCGDRRDVGEPRMITNVITTGWRPTCACSADTRPCVVLDPFGGAGTTALVSERLGRDSVLIELSSTYIHDIAVPRLRDELGTMFTTIEVKE